MHRFATVVHVSVLTSMVMMSTVGIAGYLPFGAATDSNVLDNFPESGGLITAVRTL